MLDANSKVISSLVIYENLDKILIDAAVDNFSKCLYEKYNSHQGHDNSVFKMYRYRLSSDLAFVSISNINRYPTCKGPSYPHISRRLEQSGSVVLEYKLDGKGFISNMTIKKSSGFIRLDEAAVIGLVSCKFKSLDASEIGNITFTFLLD